MLKMNESLCGSTQSLDRLCGSDESHALPELRWDGTQYKVDVKIGNEADRKTAQITEDRMVIAKDVTWSVKFEDSSSGRIV